MAAQSNRRRNQFTHDLSVIVRARLAQCQTCETTAAETQPQKADKTMNTDTQQGTFIDVRTRDDNGRFKPKQIESAPNKANPTPETGKALSEAYDIKHVDFRNLLTVVMGTLSNQTGESFDSALSRGKCADEIYRRHKADSAKADHADKLAEAIKAALRARLFSIDFEANRTPGTEQTDIRTAMVDALIAYEKDSQ